MVNFLTQWQLRQIFRSPLSWIVFAIYFFIVAALTNYFAYEYLQELAAKNTALSLSLQIFAPLQAVSLIIIFISLPLFNSQFTPTRIQSKAQQLFDTYPVKRSAYFIADLFSSFSVVFLFVFLSIFAESPLLLSGEIDWLFYLVNKLSLLVFCCVFSAIHLLVCHRSQSPSITAGLGILIIVALWLIQLLSAFTHFPLFLDWLDVFSNFRQLTSGLIVHSHAITVFISLFGLIAAGIMKFSRTKGHYHWFLLAGIFLINSIVSLRTEYSDITSNKRYTLLPELHEILLNNSAIKVQGFGIDDFARHDIQQRIVSPLSTTSDIEIHWQATKNIHSHSDRSLSDSGLEIEFDNHSLWIDYPFKQHPQLTIYQSFMTLHKRSNRWILFTDGHDESSIFKEGQRHLSKLHALLKSRGFQLNQMALTQLPEIPDNTQILVIASSRHSWLPKEQSMIKRFLENGGNLLWLRDPEDNHLEWLEEYLGTIKVPGTLMDPIGYQQGTPHPGVLLIHPPFEHPTTKNLTSLVALPWASALGHTKSRFEQSVLLRTHSKVWTEFTPDEASLQLDEDIGELVGEFNVAVSLTVPKTNQTVIVFGDSHFSTDSAIENYDNQQLVMNVFRWLMQSEPNELPRLSSPTDRHLTLTSLSQTFLGWINPFLFPVILCILGVITWFKRRRD